MWSVYALLDHYFLGRSGKVINTGGIMNILRQPTVSAKSGMSRSTLYLRISQGLWTKPVKIGDRASGWPEHEIDALNAARIADKSNDEIRTLVSDLESARKAAA